MMNNSQIKIIAILLPVLSSVCSSSYTHTYCYSNQARPPYSLILSLSEYWSNKSSNYQTNDWRSPNGLVIITGWSAQLLTRSHRGPSLSVDQSDMAFSLLLCISRKKIIHWNRKHFLKIPIISGYNCVKLSCSITLENYIPIIAAISWTRVK